MKSKMSISKTLQRKTVLKQTQFGRNISPQLEGIFKRLAALEIQMCSVQAKLFGKFQVSAV